MVQWTLPPARSSPRAPPVASAVMVARRRLALAALASLAHLLNAESDFVMVDVPATSKRCVGEEFPDDSLGKWSFVVMGSEKHKADPTKSSKVRVTVKNPRKKLMWSESLDFTEKTFSFTTKVPGLHKACVENHHSKPQRVSIAVDQGWGVRDYDGVSDSVFGPVEKQLDDSEHMLKDIAAEMDAAIERESDLRDASESGRDRVELFGVISMGVLFATACWQIIYLRSFFRSKKLL